MSFDPQSAILVRILPPGAPIPFEELRRHVSYEECGAVVTFEGVVRLTEEGRTLQALDYEHHMTMALPELEKVCRDALERYDVRRTACIHRTGPVQVQEPSVVVCVGADHRGPAFEACQYIMDTLKKTVPIWKVPVYKQEETLAQETSRFRT